MFFNSFLFPFSFLLVQEPLFITAKPKLPGHYFGHASGEGCLEVRENNLVRGVFDKAIYGNGGLVHAVHELYGSSTASDFLGSLSRLLTVYLQSYGLTCGVDDLLITPDAEVRRYEHLSKSDQESTKAVLRFTNSPKADSGFLRRKLQECLRERPQVRTSGLFFQSECCRSKYLPLSISRVRSIWICMYRRH